MEKSTGLIVVGMHRSGTSALTGALEACGAFAGANRDLTGSNAENPKGFFERKDIRGICDGLLHSAGADWWKVSDFNVEKIEPSELERQRALFADTVKALSEQQTWIIKEPRLCLLLPLLIDLVPNPICLFIYRNPIEVAKSLRTRNQISLQQGVALWEKYTLNALSAIKDAPSVVVSYQDLITQPSQTLGHIIRQLADLGVQSLGDDFSSADFIDKSLHRSVHDPDELDILTEDQRKLWQSLEQNNAVDAATSLKASAGQFYVLQDLEYQFVRQGNTAGHANARPELQTNTAIRSRKVLTFSLLLDRLVCGAMSKIGRR